MKSIIVLSLFVLTFLGNKLTLAQNFECSSEHNTLCELNNGTRACCPVKDATCCSSGDYCCPNGFKCDLDKSRCVKDSLFIPFHLRLDSNILKKQISNDYQMCPDNQTSCKKSQTCCLFQSNQYGCCPIANAICCEDQIHCCPSNYECNPSQGKCDRKKEDSGEIFSIPWKRKVKGETIKENSVVCPDGNSECPDKTTCCQMSPGKYGCCPLQNAVCCEDNLHCCPNGYGCDTANGKCVKNDVSLPFYHKIQAIAVEKRIDNTVCPDGQSQCPDGTTCCQLSSGQYGCCPFPKAVCCQDQLHCCPNGYTCDVKDGRCSKSGESFEFVPKMKANPINKEVKSVPCPDGSSYCEDGSTCCQMSSGQYGCCPLENAVCCEDHLHCCPNGYTCDVKDGRCSKGKISLPFLKKKPSIEKKIVNKEKNLKDQVCPGGFSTCPEEGTCCQIPTGQYGCCLFENAVCCGDRLHCCPNGMTCNDKEGTCVSANSTMKFSDDVTKLRIKEDIPKDKETSVPCPDGTSFCQSGATCCQLSSGAYGCCPLPNAVCCQDHLHCCPNGYTCDVKDGRCNSGEVSIPFFKKIESTKYEIKSVTCQDGKSQCPDGTTCCELSSGQFGCCPFSSAVCCEDHLHCCPNGYTCDVKDGRCNKGEISIPFFRKLIADATITQKNDQIEPKQEEKSEQVEEKKPAYKIDYNNVRNPNFNATSVVCPDGCSFCPNGNTCCKMNDGSYACCPLPNAVCCSDHLHCCPEHTQCNIQKQCCDSDDSNVKYIPWQQKVASSKLYYHEDNKGDNEDLYDDPIVCEDNVTTCDPLKICCKMDNGQYGCCPYSDGVCCSSFCCPGNSICGKEIGECIPKSKVPYYNWYTLEEKAQKVEDIPPLNENKVKSVCPGGEVTCTADGTCCQKSDGNWACCPYQNGTCCGSHGWCCPSGFTCDSKTETCTLNDLSSMKKTEKSTQNTINPTKIVKSNKKTSLAKKLSSNVLINLSNKDPSECDDSIHYCDESHTCCSSSTKQGDTSYGCCPNENAVCCSDGQNCCPNGYKCSNDPLSVTCYKDEN